MASDQSPPLQNRNLRSGLLRKQPEIEEVEEEDTSPGSDQSDTTITAGADTAHCTAEGGSPDSGSPDDLKPTSHQSNHRHNHISPKIKQLTRSEALDDCASPPLDPLQSTASTCSTDSSSSGIGTKSQASSLSGSGRGRLHKDGSESSEAGSSGLSRDSSVDTPYKDSTGIDLEDFIKKTLNKTPKDRNMLIKLEVDLVKFIQEPKHHYLKFPLMSSYDRMLVHRIAAFFGLDHNVDQTGKCVIVNKTQNTRIPDFSFQEHIHNGDAKPKMLLKRREGGSFDERTSKSLQKPSLSNKAKSFEERKQNYEEARCRIFTTKEEQPTGYSQEDAMVTGIVSKVNRPHSLGSSREDHAWSSTESSGYGTDNSCKNRILVPKANSFGGTGSFVYSHLKSPVKGASLSKADSMMGVPVNLGSPLARPSMLSSSPPCSQSDGSSASGGSVTGPIPSPIQHTLGAGSVPSPGQSQGQGQKFYWVASDLQSIPPGSLVINPQTGQTYLNADGSPYRYNPSQPLPQPLVNYPSQSPQPIAYHLPQQQEWSPQEQSTTELCQQVSVMRMTSQSSTDSGSGDQQPVAGQQSLQQQQPSQQQQQQMLGQAVPQGYNTAQPMAGQQGMYYPAAAQNMAGAPVRYVCPMSYTPPSGAPATAPQESQTFPNQFVPQYVQGYPGYQNYPIGSSQGQGSEVSYPATPAGTEQGSGGYPTYSVPLNQGPYGGSQSHMFYTVQPQTANPQMGFPYPSPGGPYQSSTPPSQSVSSSSSVNPVALSIAQPVNIGQPVGSAGGVPTAQPGAQQFVPYQQGQPGQQQTFPQFPGQQRPVTPQVVPFPSVQTHSAQSASTAFHPSVFRPSMQVTMQIPQQGMGVPPQNSGSVNNQSQQQQQQQQHSHMTSHMTSQQQQQQQQQQQPGHVTSHVTPQQQQQGHVTSHVTVSAKGLPFDNQVPKIETVGDSKEVGMSVGPRPMAPMYRPQQITQGDMRYIGQPRFPPQGQPVQFSQPQNQQLQKQSSPSKLHGGKKSQSRDRESQSPQHSADYEPGSNNILEVLDLPGNLSMGEAEQILRELLNYGAQIQYVTRDTGHGDYNPNNLHISDYANIYAVFPECSSAQTVLKNHNNHNSSGSQFKLRALQQENNCIATDSSA